MAANFSNTLLLREPIPISSDSALPIPPLRVPALPPVAVAPFHALRMYPMTRKSLGGIVIDLDCCVLNARREPIAGLYAAGEATGFGGINGKAGLEGTFIGPLILQGRRLGASLAKLASPSPDVPPTPTSSAQPPNAPCKSCHALDKLLVSSRSGYWHFERSHRVVQEKQWQCQICHAEMMPFRAGAHMIDRLQQINACAPPRFELDWRDMNPADWPACGMTTFDQV